MRRWLENLMYGRYGVDNLNNGLIIGSLVLMVINIFVQNTAIMYVSYVLWGFAIYRMFSKKVYDRKRENDKYLSMTKKLRHHITATKNNLTDKQYKYFVCSSCGQLVRVPKGKGNIDITCPKCKNVFSKKS